MSNFKRILSLALTMLMVIGCFATVSAFNDVTEYEDEIDALYDLGGIAGTANANGSEIKVTNCTVTGLSITVDQTTGYYGDKPANANGEVVGRLIGNVDTTGSTASATIGYVVPEITAANTTVVERDLLNTLYGAPVEWSVQDAWDIDVAPYENRGILFHTSGAATLKAAITAQSSETYAMLTGTGYVAGKNNVYIFNGKIGDTDFGASVAANLYLAYGAAFMVDDGGYIWTPGLWRLTADKVLTDGWYTIAVDKGDGTYVAFTEYVMQDVHSTSYGAY